MYWFVLLMSTFLHTFAFQRKHLFRFDYITLRLSSSAAGYVASIKIPDQHEIDQLASFLRRYKSIVVITGAGVSTSSGIPDYRGPQGSYKRGHKPMIHSEFVGSEYFRKRYWARSMMGWKTFIQAKPNNAHYALARLEAQARLTGLITQNVDRLHQKAGSQAVIDLHGRNDRCSCLRCGCNLSRRIIQQQVEAMNPSFLIQGKLNQLDNGDNQRADGDADWNLRPEDLKTFAIPVCPKCGGDLKPDVVFFGDNVPSERVHHVREQIDSCDALLVVGSSLEVFSAYRFVRQASSRGVPIGIINAGTTRAERDGLRGIILKSESLCSQLLLQASDALL